MVKLPKMNLKPITQYLKISVQNSQYWYWVMKCAKLGASPQKPSLELDIGGFVSKAEQRLVGLDTCTCWFSMACLLSFTHCHL